MANPLKLDPTRTVTLRKAFLSNLRKRFKQISSEVKRKIEEQDSFSSSWGFADEGAALEAFSEWYDRKSEEILFKRDFVGQPWINTFIRKAYEQGASKAYSEVNPEALSSNTAFYLGGKISFLKGLLGNTGLVSDLVSNARSNPQSRLSISLARSLEELKGVNSEMKKKLTRIVADGLSKGLSGKVISNQLRKEIDTVYKKSSKAYVNTQVVAAHAEGELDAFELLGIEEVGAEVEWVIFDEKACPKCKKNAGVRFTIAEARGKIPLHPDCRCRWRAV